MELGDSATTGGIVIVVLGMFKLLEKFLPTKNGKSNSDNSEHKEHITQMKECAKKVDSIHGWYGSKGPMDRMTTQMEQLKDETKTQTSVLVDIKDLLEKRA